MKVSVVICTYSMERYEHMLEAVESLLEQSYDHIEIIVVIDGNRDLFKQLYDVFEEYKTIVLHCNDANRGISYSRTKGAELATGDIVAFVDDDSIADSRWIEELVETYEQTNAIAVGGRMVGRWMAGRPWYLPEEFNWLVGVSYPDFATAGEEVRNTFESNISFRRDVFLGLDGYNTDFGPDAESYDHSEGAEFGIRLQAKHGKGVIYNPDAVVEHKVFRDRIDPFHLLTRAFQQGVSKRRMERHTQLENKHEESAYLRQLFVDRIPKRMVETIRTRSLTPLGKAAMLVIFTATVGIGYVYSMIMDRLPD